MLNEIIQTLEGSKDLSSEQMTTIMDEIVHLQSNILYD